MISHGTVAFEHLDPIFFTGNIACSICKLGRLLMALLEMRLTLASPLIEQISHQ